MYTTLCSRYVGTQLTRLGTLGGQIVGLRFSQNIPSPWHKEVVHGMIIELGQGIPRINSYILYLWFSYFSYVRYVNNKDQVFSQTVSMKRRLAERIQETAIDLQGQEVRIDGSQGNRKSLFSESFSGYRISCLRRGWKEVFQVMKGKGLHPRLLYPAKLSLRMEGKIKCFSDKVKLKKLIITKPLLYEMLKGVT